MCMCDRWPLGVVRQAVGEGGGGGGGGWDPVSEAATSGPAEKMTGTDGAAWPKGLDGRADRRIGAPPAVGKAGAASGNVGAFSDRPPTVRKATMATETPHVIRTTAMGAFPRTSLPLSANWRRPLECDPHHLASKVARAQTVINAPIARFTTTRLREGGLGTGRPSLGRVTTGRSRTHAL